jgi:nucleotide-binding universal stress UspA family protein
MFKRLLVPIDDSEVSPRAMRSSIELARRLGAGIVGFIAEPFGPDDRAAAAHADGVLAGFARLAHEAGVPFASHGTQACHVEEAILDAAREHDCDMIVMVTHDRGWLARLLQRSCTRQVAARSRVPLLVLHA